MWTRTLVTSCVSFGPYEDKPKAILETQLLVFLFLWLLDLFTIVVQRPLVIGTPGYAKGKRKMAYPVWRVPIWSLMNYFHFLLFFLSFSFWSQLKQRINSWAQRKRKLIEKDKKIAFPFHTAGVSINLCRPDDGKEIVTQRSVAGDRSRPRQDRHWPLCDWSSIRKF